MINIAVRRSSQGPVIVTALFEVIHEYSIQQHITIRRTLYKMINISVVLYTLFALYDEGETHGQSLVEEGRKVHFSSLWRPRRDVWCRTNKQTNTVSANAKPRVKQQTQLAESECQQVIHSWQNSTWTLGKLILKS